MEIPVIYLVVPCYNEEEALSGSVPVLRKKLEDLIQKRLASPSSRILLVNDGSKDETWQMIRRFSRECPQICGISLSRNRGHQNALLAGLFYSVNRCDATISIDADLQDDVDAMDEMLEKYRDGCEIVYGVRSDRKTDSWFKRTTAQVFYRFMSWMGVESVYNHADYRLMSKRAVKALLSFPEVNLYLRGMVPLVGYKSGSVRYRRSPRTAGESKYPFKKMLALALDGITSLSIKPLRIISRAGWLMMFVGIVLGIARMFGTGSWILASVWFVGGIQLAALGIAGAYIGRIYRQVQNRPRFFIAEETDED